MSMIITTLPLTNATDLPAIHLTASASAEEGTGKDEDGLLRITNTASDSVALSVYTNNASHDSTNPLVRFIADHSSMPAGVLEIRNDGTSGGAFDILLHSPNPDIEFRDADETGPAGKYELAVQGDYFQLNGRNAADNSFENIVTFKRANGGTILITLFNYPTSDPGVDGALWVDTAASRVLKVSAG